MKAASPALVSFLAAARAQKDLTIAFADCFSFTQTNGLALTYTNADVPVLYDGKLFRADGPLVSGLKYRATVGLNVDRQEISIAARPGDLTSGAPLLASLRDGAFDGAKVRRDRVFFSDFVGGAPVGGVTLFYGRISTIDEVGRTRAKISVANELVLLDVDMPRNIFGATCQNTLYGPVCGLPAGAFSTQANADAGSTSSLIFSPAALAGHAQGKLAFSSGANAGVAATVKLVAPGVSLTLAYPLPFTPAVGDAFTVYYGCDHTQGTCQTRFNNLANFRGFPFVPPPQMAV
jgi:uncharacterized phage protein (TIGR02218 family)